ncbi:MAG: DMT family transporter [Tepidisphaeraceae bacterium]
MGSPRPLVSYLLLTLGVVACAMSVLMLKASHTHPFWLSGARLLIAAAALSPLYWIEAKKTPQSPRIVLKSWPGAIVLVAHFVTWTLGARWTEAANGTLIVNLAPVVMPFVMFLFNGERVNRGEIIGTIPSIAGVLLLVSSHVSVDMKYASGDAMCFVSMVLFCFYLALGRRMGAGRSLWLYVVPLYAIAGVTCWATALATLTPLPQLNQREILLLLGLGLIPTVIGHSIMNWCIQHLRGQVVSVANLGQFVVAGVIAVFQFGEVPTLAFYVASVLIIAGSVIVIRSNRVSVDIDAES